tara:strand:+ start:117 stop:839 length:723 start_codon:yes stop_codon:yes gene_type:complete
MDPNQKLTGIQQLPMGQAGPPMGGPPMGGPPPGMGGPPPGMGGPPPGPMGPPSGMGGPPPMEPGMGEMAMQGQPMEEPSADPQQDAMMLTEAVIGQTRGDVDAAIALLDTAKGMLMQAAGGGQDPMMANMGRPIMMNQGGPMYKNMGGPLDYNMGGPMYANMGRPLYREDGGTMSEEDMLRQMIMQGLGQSGRTMSDKDMSGRTMSDKDMMKVMQQLSPKGQSNSTSKAMDELNKFRYGG